jgi:hypothetical protein
MATLQRELCRLSSEQFAIAFGLARLTPGTGVLAFYAAVLVSERGPLDSEAAKLPCCGTTRFSNGWASAGDIDTARFAASLK